jgi:exopolysaccharide biosynthesis polyprenyl glycosylphosphotransferase
MKKILIVSRDQNNPKRYRLIGFKIRKEKILSKFLNTLGSTDTLNNIACENDIDEVYLALSSLHPEEMIRIREMCQKKVSQIHFISDLYNTLSQKINLKEINGIPLFTMRGIKTGGFHWKLKRGVDFAGALIGLLLLAPLFGLIALLIKGTMPGPILFRQKRLGKDGVPFTFLKFRTMKENGKNVHREFVANFIKDKRLSSETYKMKDDPRITKIGYMLRRTSLDELPQLINVLRGEMSLVGPRPAIPYEIDHYQEWHKRRMSGKPGMTGLWQVSGRSSVSFNDMVLLDLYYIDNWSLWFDFILLFKTIPAVLSVKGAY